MLKRYDQIDSLRGIAVMLVMTSHISLVTAIPLLSSLFSFYFPLNMLFQGDSAVNCFFILSGFVLYLPYCYGIQSTYGIFLAKRFFRVYIPYLIAIVLSIASCMLFSKEGINELSGWFNNSWTEPVTVKNVLNHVLVIGNFNSNIFNNVIWYIVQDIRISIIFPIIAFIIMRINWKISLLFGLCLSLIGGLNQIFHWQLNAGYHTSIFYTFQYMNMFIIGGIIAKHLNDIRKTYENLTLAKKIIILLFAFISANYNFIASMIMNKIGLYFYGDLASNYCVALGSVTIIVFALFSRRVHRFLFNKPLLFLGKISYSLFLYHLPILYSLIYCFYDVISVWVIYLLTLLLSIIMATIAWYLFERPSIRYGKYVISKIEFFAKKRLATKGNKNIDHVA
ncbi:acyltransferase family protein [Heyndrickxia sp. NPDC080065]|uniref:acyltransferase family protein n=1 Tax=Heyndrickxia sp. NPDC080065 TaxID=3390568 RepID=UPI003CFEAEA9